MAVKKKDQAYIEKIIKKGTARQKGLLVANTFADQLCSGKGFLTRGQVDSIKESLKTSREIDIFNRIADAEYNVRLLIPFLETMEVELEERISFTNGICLTHHTTGKFVDLLNGLCYEYGKDLRDKIINSLENMTMLVGKVEPDKEEPFLTYQGKNDFEEMMNSLRDQMTAKMTAIKSVITAIKDFMKNKKIKITAYEELLSAKEEKWGKDASILPLYGFRQQENEEISEDLKDFMKKFQIFPNYKELPLDKDIYNQYMRSLGGVDYEGPSEG